jgi:nitroimidazol reductase NimA-like FMN-containing flavoprotein (pyridoxamine 5'-phosphate oxidase superfamily)
MIGNLNEQEIEETLKDNVWGHLGCNDGFNTYVYPINYLYDGEYILFHSQVGFKIEVMRKNKRVCFQVDEVKNHTNWKSIMILGDYQELGNERERSYAMKAFVDRRLRLKITDASLPAVHEEAGLIEAGKSSRPAIYRILVDHKSGRFEED